MAETKQKSEDPAAHVNRPRRRLALSLKGMLLVVLVLAVWLGWWVNSARKQQAAVAAIQTAPYEAHVQYDVDPDEFRDDAPVRRRLWRAVKRVLPGRLEAMLGTDYLHNVQRIAMIKIGPPGPEDRAVIRKLAMVRSLEDLSIDFEVLDEDLEQIARLPELRSLELDRRSPRLTGASWRALGGMPRLECLEIFDVPITDDALAAMEQMRGLRVLALGHEHPNTPESSLVAIKGDGLAHLAKLPVLTSLSVYSDSLRGEGLGHVGKLKHLFQLNLRSNSITDDHLRSLAPLSDLEWLHIAGLGIDGTGVRHLRGPMKLTELCLEGANVTDAAIPFLARLPALEHLKLYDTSVTAAGLEQLRSAPRLRQLDVVPDVTGGAKWKRALPRCRICPISSGFDVPRWIVAFGGPAYSVRESISHEVGEPSSATGARAGLDLARRSLVPGRSAASTFPET